MKLKTKTPKFRCARLGISLATTALAAISLSAASAQDNSWTGGISTDWNTAANWSSNAVPTGQNAVVNNTSGNIATITADLAATPNDIRVTGGGRIDHLAGTAGTGGGSWMFVGLDSTLSTYNLADTSVAGGGITGYAQGTGTVNATGNFNLAAFGGSRVGTMNMNTTGALNVTGAFRIGNDGGSVGVMNLESGAVIVSNINTFAGDENNIGHGGGDATFNISGGSFDASRNFRVGNEGGTGTVTITGGSLTIGGTDDIFIGRDRGTGVVNQSGGVVDFNHNTFIGNGNNAGSDTSGTYTLSDGVLNVRREFAIGREGANATHTGTLTMTGGTINKTGDEKMIVGQNNGKGIVTHSGGTINVNNELLIGNENAGAEGTYTISGTAALNVGNELIVGRESGTGTLNVDGGTITTTGNGNMYVGRKNGTGTLNQTAGTISVNREFGVGTTQDGQAGIGSYDLSGGSLTAAGNIFIGKEQASSGTMTMSGGTMNTSDKLQIGHNQATGVLTQSGGIVNVQNEVFIGNESNASSVGTYTLSGTGALNVGNQVIVGRDNGTGTLNLNGGTVTTKWIEGGSGSASVNFNGGVLKAKENQGSFIRDLDVANVQSGGIKIDSNGFDVATSQALTGTGGLEKLGAGSLTLNAASTYTGPTLVSAGTLKLELNSSITSAVTVEAGAALAGAGAIAGDLSFNSGAKFAFSLTQTLLANGNTVSFADFGIDDLVGLSDTTDVGTYTLIGGSATINTNGLGNLGLENAFDLGGGKSAYFIDGSLQVTVVPEPSTYALLVLAGLGMAGHVIRRRR